MKRRDGIGGNLLLQRRRHGPQNGHVEDCRNVVEALRAEDSDQANAQSCRVLCHTYEAFDDEEEDSEQGEAPNATNEQAEVLLKAIPRRIEALLDSAAQTGAQTALQTVLSWYPQV